MHCYGKSQSITDRFVAAVVCLFSLSMDFFSPDICFLQVVVCFKEQEATGHNTGTDDVDS